MVEPQNANVSNDKLGTAAVATAPPPELELKVAGFPPMPPPQMATLLIESEDEPSRKIAPPSAGTKVLRPQVAEQPEKLES